MAEDIVLDFILRVDGGNFRFYPGYRKPEDCRRDSRTRVSGVDFAVAFQERELTGRIFKRKEVGMMSVEREMVVNAEIQRESEKRKRDEDDRVYWANATKGQREYFERNHRWPGEYVPETD